MIGLLLNADVYAPEPLGVRNLAVCAGRLIWMGAGDPGLPRELVSERRDLGGRRLIPGLIDGHAHITGGGGESGAASRVPPVALSRFTRGGITSVVGLLGTDDVTRDTASLVAAARGLTEEGLSAWCYCGGYHVPPVTLTGSVRGDIVLVDRIIGVGELALSDHRSSQPTLDELLRIASEAHVAGIMTGKAGIVHLHMGDGSRGLELVRAALEQSELPPRVFQPTHVNRRKGLFNEALHLAERGCTIDLTAFPVEEGEDAWEAGEALARYLDTGLPRERVTISSDAGGCLPEFDAAGQVTSTDIGRPGALAETLAGLLRRDMPLELILPAFTSNVADLLRLHGKGRVAVGSAADFSVLDEHGEVAEVMAGGRWHVQEGEVVVRGAFEEAGDG